MKKNTIVVLSVVFVALGAWMFGVRVTGDGVKTGTDTVYAKTVTVYKSPTCGCCTNYVAYLKRYGFEVELIETEDMDNIKREHNIPYDMESCHTTLIDGRVVEGHIPVEGIERMFVDDSDVNIIAIPGMPSGSPGMPGAKKGLFTIYEVNESGTSEFIQL
jgi:hypothetical protein